MATATATNEQQTATSCLTREESFLAYNKRIGRELGKPAGFLIAQYAASYDSYNKKGTLEEHEGVKAVYLANDVLIEELDLSERTIVEAKRVLEEAGYIKRIHRFQKPPLIILTEKFWNMGKPEQAEQEQEIQVEEQKSKEVGKAAPALRSADIAAQDRKNCGQKELDLKSLDLNALNLLSLNHFIYSLNSLYSMFSVVDARAREENIQQEKEINEQEMRAKHLRKYQLSKGFHQVEEDVRNHKHTKHWDDNRIAELFNALAYSTKWNGIYNRQAVQRALEELPNCKKNPAMFTARIIEKQTQIELDRITKEQDHQELLQQFPQLDRNNIAGDFAEVFEQVS